MTLKARRGVGVVQTPSDIFPVKRGEALIGVRIHNDRVLDPGRRMTIAEYNREFGEHFAEDAQVMTDCRWSGSANSRPISYFDNAWKAARPSRRR